MAKVDKQDVLSQADKSFIKEFVISGNATRAVKKSYAKGKNKSENAIAVQGQYYLTKPKIVKGIQQVLDDDFLASAHAQLFNQVRVEYFVFPKKMSDEEITGHVESVGIKVITIRESDRGKLAFYSLPDAVAIKSALEMAFKIKGTYAPEKSVILNLVEEIPERVKALAKRLNAPT